MDFYFAALAILLVVIAAVLVRGILRRADSNRPRERPVAMDQVWAQWPSGGDDAERARRAALLAQVSDTHREAVRTDLEAFERRALGEREPLPAFRRELMDSVDRRMLNREILALPENLRRRLREQSGDVIGSDAQAQAYLAANELRLEMLREYCARRWNDRAPQDWFAVYEHAAQLKRRTVRRYIDQGLAGELTGAADARQQAIGLVDSQLRAHLLKVAPGTRFAHLTALRDGE